MIQIIPSIAQWVGIRDGELGRTVGCRRCYRKNFTPSAVGIGGDECSCVIGNADNVTHLVCQVEILCAIQSKTDRRATVIILEVHGVRPVGLRQDDAIFCCEVRRGSIDRFAGPDAVFVIGIAVNVRSTVRVRRVYSDLAEHSAVCPLELHVAIGQDIAIGIVSQACAIDAGQLIRPGRVLITEDRCFFRKGYIVTSAG